jgi:hypothetical protein
MRAASSTATSSPKTSCCALDGTVALADFGIAKSMLKTENMA